MRFLHTADWQIGMKAAHAGQAAAQVREERLASARRVVEAAREASAEFIVVAGDTFEDNGVERVLIQRVADILASFGGPVYIIPGNHDPFVPGSVWEHPAWKAAANVHVLVSEEPVEVPGGLLFPCPLREVHADRDPTAWVRVAGQTGIKIGLAHGSVEGIVLEEPDYPIPRDAAERAGLDYVALGHWHSTGTYPDGDGAVRLAYSGTHEQTKFGERDSGNALVVDISGPGAPPDVRPVRVGRLNWLIEEAELREAGDLVRLRSQVEAIPEPAATLVEVRLRGVLSADDEPELRHLEDILAARFLLGRLDASALVPSPADDVWLASLPAGVIRLAAERLRDMAQSAGPKAIPAPEVISRALLELYALSKEAAR